MRINQRTELTKKLQRDDSTSTYIKAICFCYSVELAVPQPNSVQLTVAAVTPPAEHAARQAAEAADALAGEAIVRPLQ